MELEIDAKELLRQALAEAEPGEDIEEALLRICKRRYPEQYTELFPDILGVIEMMTEQMRGSKDKVIRELVETDGSMSITLHSSDVVETKTYSGDPEKVLKELPPDIREEVRKTLAEGSGDFKIEKRIVRRTSSKGMEMIDCRCGYLGPPEEDHCPKCGRRA